MFRTIRRKRAAAMIVGILFVGIPVIISLIFSSKPRTDLSGPLIQGQPVSYWIRTLPQEADMGFVDYNHPLEKAGPEIIPALIRALESDHDRHVFYRKLLRVVPSRLSRRLAPPDAPMHRIKSFAAFRLGQFGPLASNAVPALARIVKTNSFASGRAIQALGNIGSASEPALAAIAEAFKNPQVAESWPTTALLQIGKIPPEVIGYLETQAGSNQGNVAGPAVVALWLAKRDLESLERVHAFLESTNASFRAHTAISLSHHDEIPPQTKQILRALLRACLKKHES